MSHRAKFNGGLVAEGTRYDTRIKSAAGIQAKMDADPVFASEFRGKTAQEIHEGDEMVVYDSEKRSFAVGGSGKKGGSRVSSDGNYSPGLRGNGAGGMFGTGKWGSLFYGGYLLKREWQMSAGQTLASAEKYGEGMADYAGIMYDGASMEGSDVGFAHRQEVGESYMGKAAYSSFGAYMDLPYRLSQSGSMGAARMFQQVGISAGVAMGGAITGSMLTAGGMTAAGGALATGGLVVGGLMLAGVGAMEAWNAWGKPEDAPDVTLSTPVDNFRKDNARREAAIYRNNALYGNTFKITSVCSPLPGNRLWIGSPGIHNTAVPRKTSSLATFRKKTLNRTIPRMGEPSSPIWSVTKRRKSSRGR